MTDDLLKRATSALRDDTAQPELRSGLTRARLLDNAAKQQKKRANPLRWMVPFVLTLGAGTALAHVTHQYFPEVWNAVVPDSLERTVPDEEVVRLTKKLAKKRTPEQAAPSPNVPMPMPALSPSPEPEAAALEPEAPTPKPSRKRTAPAPLLAPAQPDAPILAIKPAAPEPPAESAELALFRRAQKLHTAKDRNAIAAWDDFLRVAPKSPLATEARYNRALGLIRAGRSDDARKALAPFARGDMDGYRQREAADLIEALDERDAGVRAR